MDGSELSHGILRIERFRLCYFLWVQFVGYKIKDIYAECVPFLGRVQFVVLRYKFSPLLLQF